MNMYSPPSERPLEVNNMLYNVQSAEQTIISISWSRGTPRGRTEHFNECKFFVTNAK